MPVLQMVCKIRQSRWLCLRSAARHTRVYSCRGQLLFFGTVDLLLQFQCFDLQIVPTEKGKETVEAGQHGVDTPHGISLLQLFFIADYRFLGACGLLCVCRKGTDIPDIFFDGCGTPFL